MFFSGNSNINEDRSIPDAIDMRVNGAHIIVIAIGTQLNMLELKGIASQPIQRTLFTIDSIRNLPTISNNIVAATCDGMILN